MAPDSATSTRAQFALTLSVTALLLGAALATPVSTLALAQESLPEAHLVDLPTIAATTSGPGGPGVDVTPPPPCLPDVPFLVDECGDTMIGDLTMKANVIASPGFGVNFPAGPLRGDGGALTFNGAAVCLANFAPADCGGWGLTGNAGTNPATNFLGTTTNVPLILRANNVQAFRLEPTASTPNVIGGASSNSVAAGKVGGVIGGGSQNTVSDDNSFIGAGRFNKASGPGAVVSGGDRNEANFLSFVGGGHFNVASSQGSIVVGGGFNTAGPSSCCGYQTVAGGAFNSATGGASFIGGGTQNAASGGNTFIAGGNQNVAAGDFSFAAGSRAKANHKGAFVWSDSQNFDFASTAANQFSVRATGGARFVSAIDGSGNPTAGVSLASGGGSWTSLSDRALKQNVEAIDARGVLARVAAMPLSEWSYTAQPGARHIGPMAQDFRAAFGLGVSDTGIDTVDADGVALAAIQGLYQEAMAKDARIASLEEANHALEARLAALEARVD